MSHVLWKIDDCVIDGPFGFQKLANLIQSYFGWSHLQVAQFMAVVFSSTALHHLFTHLPDKDEADAIFGFPHIIKISIVILMTIFVFLNAYDVASRQGSACTNPFRTDGVYVLVRVVSLAILPLAVLEIILKIGSEDWVALNSISNIALISSLYLLACEKTPPNVTVRSRDR